MPQQLNLTPINFRCSFSPGEVWSIGFAGGCGSLVISSIMCSRAIQNARRTMKCNILQNRENRDCCFSRLTAKHTRVKGVFLTFTFQKTRLSTFFPLSMTPTRPTVFRGFLPAFTEPARNLPTISLTLRCFDVFSNKSRRSNVTRVSTKDSKINQHIIGNRRKRSALHLSNNLR